MTKIAEVRFSCGRAFLFVAGIAVAMQGEVCHQQIPEEFAEPIPEEEMRTAHIGGKPISELPMDVVRFFRPENWTVQSLTWAAAQINEQHNKKET